MTDIEAALKALSEGRVDFVVVGGVAATVLGSARLTYDLDIVYSRAPENIERLVRTVGALSPYLRGAPPGLPFRWDSETVRRGLNFTLQTSLGALDLLGEVTGGGGYESLLPHTVRSRAYGVDCLILGLDKLIQVKRAAGRPKDLEAIAELEAIREERQKRGL